MLTKERKPFSNEEFVRKYLQHIVQEEICPEKKKTAYTTARLSCPIII
jgi:hypothetical protein